MRTDDVNEYEKEALRQLLLVWPTPLMRDTCTVNLRTFRMMEKKALVTVRWVIDNDTWPPRQARASDRKWEVVLTGKGTTMALILGYDVHPEELCMVPMACQIHTPFLENRIKPPSLQDDGKEREA